jgi:hypothetical protein
MIMAASDGRFKLLMQAIIPDSQTQGKRIVNHNMGKVDNPWPQ